MTRHERRKAARARKSAKGAKLNARAMQVLKAEQRKRNLVRRMPKRSSKGMGNSPLWDGTRYLKGYGTGIAKGEIIEDSAARKGRSLQSDVVASRYKATLPNCQKADWKGPFKKRS